MFFIHISGIHGPISMIFGYVFHPYLRNSWPNYHDFWICFLSISQEFMDQFSWFLDMFFINISGFHGQIVMIFMTIYMVSSVCVLREGSTSFLQKRCLFTMPLGIMHSKVYIKSWSSSRCYTCLLLTIQTKHHLVFLHSVTNK